MKVWIIKEGEPLPCTSNPRLMRMGLLAKYLAENGHEVTWWSSTFVHGTKEYWANEYTDIEVEKNERLLLLHSKVVYQKNVSLRRIRYHQILAKEFRKHCQDEEKPDVILCSYPTVQFAREANRYGKKHNVPVILDARDLWPDIFTRAFPPSVEWIAKIGILPLEFQAKRAFRKADAIVGIVPAFLEWGLKKAGRKKTSYDRTIYIGYEPDEWKDEEEKRLAIAEWQKYGVSSDTWNICFFGTMSNSSLDMETCIKAVMDMSEEYPNIRLVLCGDGDGLERYKRAAGGKRNIVFPGWSGKKQIQSLLEISKAGIYPFHNLMDFKNTFSNKIIGYMAERLPVLSSLSGFSKEYIEHYNIGVIYEENDVGSCRRAIESLYKNEEERVKKAENAYNRFCADFYSDIVNRQFEDLMKDIIERKRG